MHNTPEHLSYPQINSKNTKIFFLYYSICCLKYGDIIAAPTNAAQDQLVLCITCVYLFEKVCITALNSPAAELN